MVPKPKSCDQDWLSMQSVEGGRICGACNNLMTDFTGMSWSEIEQLHNESNGRLCGMYSQKQLDNWGREVPSGFSKCSKSAAILASIFAALNFQSPEAKPIIVSGNNIYLSRLISLNDTIPNQEKVLEEKAKNSISGIVTDKMNEPIIGVSIHFIGTEIGTISNINGEYEIEIPDFPELQNQILRFSYTGFETRNFPLNQPVPNPLILEEGSIHLTNFTVRQPTRWEQFKYWFKNLFK